MKSQSLGGARAARLVSSARTERDAYDEYRVKLFKIACRQAQEERERLREQWEARNRERG